MKTKDPPVYQLSYSSPYCKDGSMLFDSFSHAAYFFASMARSGNVRATLRLLCAHHAQTGKSWEYGKCCRIIDEC